MKVKLSHKSVVFKITEDELKALQLQKTLTETISFGAEKLCFVLLPITGAAETDNSQLNASFDKKNGVITLGVHPDAPRSLSEMGRSKEGIAHDGGGMRLFLQVDLKKDSRLRKSG